MSVLSSLGMGWLRQEAPLKLVNSRTERGEKEKADYDVECFPFLTWDSCGFWAALSSAYPSWFLSATHFCFPFLYLIVFIFNLNFSSTALYLACPMYSDLSKWFLRMGYWIPVCKEKRVPILLCVLGTDCLVGTDSHCEFLCLLCGG